MRSTSVNSPILTLNYDALSEVAQRLPVVGSEKPWRDLNSLATTCKVLLKWKERKVNAQIKAEWLRVNLTISARSGWRKGLKSIIGDYENSPTRLFREPILRKTATKVKPLSKGYETEGYEDFITQIFLCREIVTLKEIQDCLSVIRRSELPKRSRVLWKLSEFLPSLSSAHRQEVLRSMFELLDRDWFLGRALRVNAMFDQLDDALGDDAESKSLLCLGLNYRNLDSSYPDEKKLESYLKCIPNEKRWSWILDSVPECLTTKLGMRIMLNDPACRPQMINHLDKSFSECLDEPHRLAFCEKISSVYSNLCECRDGEMLAKKILRMVLKGTISENKEYRNLSTRYMHFLIKHINLVKTYFGRQEKEHLKNAIFKSIKWLIKCQESDQLASLFIALAENDTELFKKLHFSGLARVTWRDLLKHAGSIASLDIRYTYISTLYKATRHFSTVDQEFEEIYSIQLEAIKRGYKVQATT